MTPAVLTRIWRKTLRAEAKGIRRRHTRTVETEQPSPAVAVVTISEADRREAEAIAEGIEQLNSGWTPQEVLAVLTDAHLTIADLRHDAQIAAAAS